MYPSQMVFILSPAAYAYFTLSVETDIRAQLTRAVTEMILEQKKREDIEQILADVKRECRHPIIVPALLRTIDKTWLHMT